MHRQILAFLLIVGVALASCPADYNINNLASDSVVFTVSANASSTSQNYNYNFPKAFGNTPVVALALQDFTIGYLGAGVVAVAPVSLSNSQIAFQFDYTASVWSRVKVNFWASSNSQIQLGYFRVDNIQTMGSCNCAAAYANIIAPFNQNDNPVIRVFINGFDVDSNSVQLSVSPTNLQGTKLTIKVTVGANTNLKRIWLSWLAFSPSTASFGSYGGQISQNKYSDSVSSDISSSLYQNTYSLYGLNLISLVGSEGLTFTSLIDNNYILTISSSAIIDSFSLVYISVGVLPSRVCSNCGKSTAINGANCVQSCPPGTLPFTYKDGAVGCKTCSAKLGLILSGNQCIPGTTTTTTITTTRIVVPKEDRPSVPVVGVVSQTQQAATSTTSNQNIQTTSSQATQTTSSTSTQSNQVSQSSGTSATVKPATPSTISQRSASSTASSQTANIVSPACPERSYFNQIECVCEVGFVYINGKCRTPSIPTITPITVPTGSSSSSSSLSSSSSSSSSGSASANVPSTPKISAPSTGSSVSCGANSYDNGLGVCICSAGYYLKGSSCIAGSACPPNSYRLDSGACACQAGFTDYSGVCSKCPPGSLWSSASSKCIYVCSQNAAYSEAAGACVCNPGFGLYSGSCQACPNNYFISNGYCVTCPVNSFYNAATKKCDCTVGFLTNQWGVCEKKCGTNEVYTSSSQGCSCIQGLGRVNGACQVCPAGSTPTFDRQSCSICGANQILSSGKCVCRQGFAFNSAKICVACSELPNGFLIEEVCAVCPGSMIYNGQKCACPSGKTLVGSTCISQCQSDELLDSNGNCYTCGLNQVISNGKCVCAVGYSLSSCGVCVLSCQSNQFAFQGGCATCPLNTIFNSAINGCSCPTGFYMDSYGICQQLTLKAITCPDGQYFNSNTGCEACNANCKTCKTANFCTTCTASGFSANSQGLCVAVCGDGVILGTQTCDTGSSYSSGCVGCQIQSGWSCSGQPSVCRANAPVTQPTQQTQQTQTQVIQTNQNTGSGSPETVSTAPNAASLIQTGKINTNSNNVFITLKTNPTFTFANPTEMQNFIQATFSSGPKPTVFCNQRNSPNLDTFDCLMIYPSGIPNSSFEVNFSYNFQGKSASTTVKVSPIPGSGRQNSRSSA